MVVEAENNLGIAEAACEENAERTERFDSGETMPFEVPVPELAKTLKLAFPVPAIRLDELGPALKMDGINDTIKMINGIARTVAQVEALAATRVARMVSPLTQAAEFISRTSGVAAIRLQPFQEAADQAKETLIRLRNISQTDTAVLRASLIAQAAAGRSIAMIHDLQQADAVRIAMMRGVLRGTERPFLNPLQGLHIPRVEFPVIPRVEFPVIPGIQLPKVIDFVRLRDLFVHLRDEIRSGHEAFNSSEYSFLTGFVTASFITHLGRLSYSERSAEVSDRMWRLSRTQAFEDVLHKVCLSHPKLAPRWLAISQGVSVHRDGMSHAAICTLIPQVEGILTDVMLARGEAMYDGSNYYALKPDGKPLRKGNGDRVILNGLGIKVRNCHPSDAPKLHSVNDRLIQHLPDLRNGFSHGEIGSQGDQETSTQLVWGIYAFIFAAALEFIAQDAVMSGTAAPAQAREMAQVTLKNERILLTHDVFFMAE